MFSEIRAVVKDFISSRKEITHWQQDKPLVRKDGVTERSVKKDLARTG